MTSQTKVLEQKVSEERRALVLSVCFGAIFVALSSSPVSAHEVRPAYLQLHQTGTDTYDVLWKVPARGENMRLGIYVEFPSDTPTSPRRNVQIADDALIERWSVKRTGGLTGGKIYIAGLAATMTDVLVRIENLDGTTQVTRLTPSLPSFVVAAAPGALEISSRLFGAGGGAHFIRHRPSAVRAGLADSGEGMAKLVGTITGLRSRTASHLRSPLWDSCMSLANQSRRPSR